MRIIEIIKNACLWHVTYPIDKIINTVIWILHPKNNVIVINGWIKHRGKTIIPNNFGDDINYPIVEYISGKRVVSYIDSYVSLFRTKNYMCIGSIIDYMANKESVVWGSGCLWGDVGKSHELPKKIFAVRGPLTRQFLIKKGLDCPDVYGDPAILLPLLYKPRNKKKLYKVGLIPHYIEYDSSSVHDFKKKHGDSVVVVNMKRYGHWKEIVDLINECEYIASSSLHGLIIANAYKIPNVWIRFSDSVLGEDFKYQDYYLGCGMVNMAPLDCRYRGVGFDEIVACCQDYTQPRHNVSGLINVCPFISEDRKKELLRVFYDK